MFMQAAMADFGYEYDSLPPEAADFTGESVFQSGIQPAKTPSKGAKSNNATIPPLKRLRLKLQNKLHERAIDKANFAPTSDNTFVGETETSEYASNEETEAFEEMSPDGFEADEEAIQEKGKKHHKNKKNKVAKQEDDNEIILDCETVDYDTPNYLINAKGNVNVTFVKQNTVVQADTIVFDRMNNTIKAEGNVKIIKGGRTITGDYIFVDLNEENALIENPVSETATIVMRAQKGYVYGDKVVQEKGSLKISDDYPIDFKSARKGPTMSHMILPKNAGISTDIEKGIVKFKAKEIKITQKGDLETIAIKRGVVKKGERTIFKIPAVKIYTNKNHDYVETNFWEVGSYRGLGVYTGPGWVFELPKGSVVKAIPFFNYKSGAGIGGMLRFSSGTNQTTAAYGTSAKRFFVNGKQILDDKLSMQYAVNSYMEEGFLGRRRPKYGVSLNYHEGYSSDNFLLKGHASSFAHNIDVGYFQDLDFDGKFEKIQGHHMGTTRFRYMADAYQNLIDYRNEDKLTAFRFGLSGQLAASVYGNGDTQTIGRIGPSVHTQYKRWMQDISYYFSAYDDHTPMPAFDAYRYGKQVLYLREYYRLCNWLMVSWFGAFNLSNDSADRRKMQECSFYLSIGPDDFKTHLGFDFIRQALYCNFEVHMDAKGTNVEYDKLEIKQDKKSQKEEKVVEAKPVNDYEAPTAPKELQKAVVENVKVMEDVL